MTISSDTGGARAVYGRDEIDEFFVIDGEINAYVIPIAAVEGFQTLTLTGYADCRVVEAGRWTE